MRKLFLLLSLVSISLAWAQYNQELNRYRSRVAICIEGQQDVSRLVKAAIDMDYCSAQEGVKVFAYATPEEVKLIEFLGYRTEPAPVVIGQDCADYQYHTYETVTSELKGLAQQYPKLTKLESIGTSVQGRELWMLKISDNAAQDEPEPEVKYVSTMHGDETVGQEMLMYLSKLLLEQYGTDSEITRLVDDLEIWIMPNMNPDGTALRRRYNANFIDLNRNFPDPQDDPNNTPSGRAIETQHMMKFTAAHNFCISLNFHGGALVVNYPWDTKPGDAPDIAAIKHLSLGYAVRNKPMYNSPQFKNGITNGYDWYEVNCGMQDWNYHWYTDVDLTVEVSASKWPDASKIPQYWEENRDSLLWYLSQARQGLCGMVSDAITKKPVKANLTVLGIDKTAACSPLGDYQRILLAGTYTIKFTAPGYQEMVCKGVKVAENATTQLHVSLTPLK